MNDQVVVTNPEDDKTPIASPDGGNLIDILGDEDSEIVMIINPFTGKWYGVVL